MSKEYKTVYDEWGNASRILRNPKTYEDLWTKQELKVMADLAKEKDMSELAILRQALRMYQMHVQRLKDGETCTYSGDALLAREFVGEELDREFPPEEIYTDVQILETGDSYFEHAQWEGPTTYVRKDIAIEDKLKAVRIAKND